MTTDSGGIQGGMDKAQWAEIANGCKDRGDAAFKAREFHAAVWHYTAGLRLESGAGEALVLHNNRAMASLKAGLYHSALADTKRVLKAEPDNVKALFRQGQAYIGLEEHEEAAGSLRRVVTLAMRSPPPSFAHSPY